MSKRPRAPSFIRGDILLQRWYVCNRKRRFKSKEAAVNAIKLEDPVEPYSCPYCYEWHLGRRKGVPKNAYYS